MRRLFMACAGAAALFMSTTFVPNSAQAITLAAPAGLSKAIQDAKLTEDVAYVCRGGWWWRRCGWAPGPYWGVRVYRPYAFYRPYYAYYRPYAFYRPYYAYYRPYYRPYAYYSPYRAYAFGYVGPRRWLGWRRPWWW
jgi:hypothetical protein